MRDLNGTVSWVTGGGSGIGLAGAQKLAESGSTVIISGRRKEVLEEAAQTVNGKVETLPLDVADEAAVHEAAEGIIARHGRIDILVNSAGINVPNRRWADMTPTDFKRIADINLNGIYYCIHAVLPQMRKQQDGLVINISSWAGARISYLTGPAYTATKHAVVALNHSLNIDECVNGIRACVINPGEVATPILDQRPVPVTDEQKAKMLQPEDMGETILYVARMPAHACVNEILISPVWNRTYPTTDNLGS
jgi:NADP-dependent 3-hydroxy acid dehydrogenase YdfG